MKTVLFKDMPTKKNIRIFFNDRLFKAKVKKISTYNSRALIMTIAPKDFISFSPPYGYIQSVNFTKKEYTIAISKKEYCYLNNEINFFRKFPEDAKKRNVTVI